MQSDVNQKRAMRRKKARRRRIKIAFIFFLIITLITLAIMCFTVFFKIKEVKVTGSAIYKDNTQEIIKASGLVGENLFVASEKKVEDKIRKSMPYVDDVSLERKFPDKVVLTITDAKEKMYFEKDNKYYIVSENGYVLKEQEEVPENAFQIISNGIGGNIGELVNYENENEQSLSEKIVKSLDKHKIYVNKIDATNPLAIVVEVENRFTVLLGKDEYTEEKIAHLSSMIESIGERSGNINLSMWTPQNSQGSFVENKS